MTSILVTHDVAESLKIVDYIYFISEGKVVAHGDVASHQGEHRSLRPPVRRWRTGWSGAFSLSGEDLPEDFA